MNDDRSRPRARLLAILLSAALATLAAPGLVAAHAELETSDPAAGASVQGPYGGPIVLTFSEAVFGDSGAEIHDSAGVIPSTATIAGAVITVTPTTPLAEGEYEIQWTSIADDGHVERGSFLFTVLAPTPEPTVAPTATPEPTVATSPSPSAEASETPSLAPSATPSPTPGAGDAASGSDVLLPIVLVALFIIGLALFLMRRRGSTADPT